MFLQCLMFVTTKVGKEQVLILTVVLVRRNKFDMTEYLVAEKCVLGHLKIQV